MNTEERTMWAFLHDAVSHPLMAFTNWSAWSLRFHDWTSFHAWPRVQSVRLREPVLMNSKWGMMVAVEVQPKFWRIQHPNMNNAIVQHGDDAVVILETAERYFQSLADEFGGPFMPGAPETK
jgi:hypothetical protein